MKFRDLAVWALAALLLASFVHDVLAQGRRPRMPGQEDAGPDYFNLGPVGMMGMPGADGITVRHVDADGRAARAGIKVGDVIVGVSGKAFAAGVDFIEAYGEAFDKAEETDGKFTLDLRGGRSVEVSLKKTGKHDNNEPGDKSEEALKAAANYIASKQMGDGSFPTMLGGNNGKCVVTSLCGLVLMSTGQKAYQANIDRAAAFVMKNAGVDNFGNPTWDQTNWGLGYGCWFIASYYNQKKDPAAKEALQRFADTLSANQVKGGERGGYEKGGGWAHGPAKNGPNALNYLELEIVSNYALAGLALCKHAGCNVDESAIKRAQAYIADCTTGRGGVAYSTRRGQFPGTAEPGRTSGALFAMLTSNADSGLCGRMAGYIKAFVDRVPFGHGSPTLHMLAGAMGANAAGRDNWLTYWRRWRIRIMTCRREDGAFTSWPTKETQQIGNTDLKVGRLWTTANLALILGLRRGYVPLLQGKLKGVPTAPGLRDDPRPTPRDPDPAVTNGQQTPEPGSGDPAGTAGTDGAGGTGTGDQPEPQPAEPAPILYPKGTKGYDVYMNVAKMIIPPGHRALKAESFSESFDMLNDDYRKKLELLAGRMVNRASGEEKEALKVIRDTAAGK